MPTMGYPTSTIAVLAAVAPLLIVMLVVLCSPLGILCTSGIVVQTTDPTLELEYNYESLTVIRQGRDHILSQFVRYTHVYDDTMPNFLVVYDTFEQQGSAGDNPVGNTTFIGFDLKEQNSLEFLTGLDQNEDLDDRDLLFTFMITVPHIAHRNRYCITPKVLKKFDNTTTITCFVIESQTLSIHFYPLTDLRSGFTRHVPLNGTQFAQSAQFAQLNSRSVYIDDSYVYVSIVQLHPLPNLLTVIRFDLDYSDNGEQYLVFNNVASTSVLLSPFSNSYFAIIYESTLGDVVLHLIDRSMFKSVNHVAIVNVALPNPDKVSEYITKTPFISDTQMAILVRNKTLDNISIIQFISGNSTHIPYRAIPIDNAASITVDSMNYAFTSANELLIYGMDDIGKFSYTLVTAADGHITKQFSVPLRTKQYKDKFAPIILIKEDTDTSPHYFAALLGSQIRLFKDNVSRSSSYDFSAEDTTMTKIHGSVLKDDSLVMILEGCLALVDLKNRSFVQIYRLSYGNSRSFFSTIIADPRNDHPYLYLTYDSEMRGNTKFMKLSFTTRKVESVITDEFLHSKGGLFHNGLIYFQSAQEVVEYDPSRNTIRHIVGLDAACFTDQNFLHLVNNATLLSIGQTLCDIRMDNFSLSGTAVKKDLFPVKPVFDVNFVHYSSMRSKLLLFRYRSISLDTVMTVIPFNDFTQLNSGESSGPKEPLRNLEVRASLDHSFEGGKNCTLLFGQEPFMSTSRVLLLSEDWKTLASIDNLPIQVRSAFRLNDEQLLLIGDRMQVMFFDMRLLHKKTESDKVAPDLLRYILPAVIIPLTFAILLFFILFVGACHMLRKRRKLANELEERLLSEMEMQVSSVDGIHNLNSYMIPIEDITFSKRLSEGASGVVFLGSWKGAEVAIKRFKVDDEQSFIKEVTILAQLRHPYLLALYGASIDDHGHHYMITPFAKNGSLDNLLYKSKAVISFSDKLRILSQMAQAMTYLHQKEPKKIIHRDLKPQNVLLQDANQVKICDFGVSKTAGSNTMTIQSFGTLEYMAPELLLQLAKYDEKVDVYSFGIMMYELFFRKKPYSELESGLGLFALGNKVLLGERPKIPFEFETEDAEEQKKIIEQFVNEHRLHKLQSRLNEEFKQAILSCVRSYFVLGTRCWSAAPEERPSFPSIEIELKHIQDQMQPFGI